MFSPMSSGRDKWEEGGNQSSSNTKAGNAAASGSNVTPTGSGPFGAIRAGKSKGKSRQRENLAATGRVTSPTAPDKLSLGFDFRKIGKGLGGGAGAAAGQGEGIRGQRRDRYPVSSVDDDLEERQRLLSSPTPSSPSIPHKTARSRRRAKVPRWKDAFRPNKKTVDRWMESWTARWTVLAIVPSVFVWVWSAMPFPGSNQTGGHSHADGQFVFFLIWYYGVYSAVGLIYITQLFSLYRLNWWPAALGARKSYISFWLLSIVAGYVLHSMGWDRLPSMGRGWLFSLNDNSRHDAADDEEEVQWQRKTPWVGLALATMAMPALVCFAGLRRGGRQTYRHSLTDTQKTFLENDLNKRIPASYIRFLWFMAVIGVALIALLAGQGYASVYLSTLPHTGLDGTAYVAFWTINVNVLLLVSHWILEEKVRSRALLFVIKYYYFLVYFIFYRNLFARLRSFDQFALIQLLSSFWVCIWYPFSMTRWCHDLIRYFTQSDKSYEEYVESVGLAFYLRNLAQNTTMLAFLGWVSILHFGPNKNMYPFFSFADKHDPYNYQLTIFGSLAIWASELASSFIARQICLLALDVDVTNLGLDEMRSYPELVTSVMWTSIHVLMDMLLFLIKLDFS